VVVFLIVIAQVVFLIVIAAGSVIEIEHVNANEPVDVLRNGTPTTTAAAASAERAASTSPVREERGRR
jgi:hypothetical protein